MPLVVLTHFHADHVDGLAGRARRARGRRGRDHPAARPARGRRGGRRPPDRRAWCRARAVRRRPGRSARSRLQALWPPPDSPTTGPGDGSTANDASVVLLVEVRGRPDPADRRRRARGPGGAGPGAARGCGSTCSRCPHHGSRYQDERLAALARRPGRAGLGRRRQRLRPPGAARRWTRSRRPARGCCAPTWTATWRWSCADGDLAHRDPVSQRSPRRRRAVAGLPHHGRSLAAARGRRPRPGHAGDRQGGVPQRAHGRARCATPSATTTPRRSSPRPSPPTSRWPRSASWRPRRCSRASAAWSCAAWRTSPRSRSTGCSATPPRRPRRSRWCWCTAAGRRAAARSPSCASCDTVTESKSGELRPSEYPGFVAAEVRRPRRDDRPGRRRLPGPGGRPGPALAVGRGRPADQRLPRRAADRREGEAVLRRPGRGEVLRRRRRRLLGAAHGGARGAALGARRRHRAGAGHLGVRRRRPRAWPATSPRRAGCARPTWPARSGVPPWKLRTIRDQSRGWSDGGIARAIRAIAQADADIKGAASDASYTLERLVLTITGLRDPR